MILEEKEYLGRPIAINELKPLGDRLIDFKITIHMCGHKFGQYFLK